jgi:glycosyltransferase involved in cell wall biosynthesis
MATYRLTNRMVDQVTAVSQAAFDRVVGQRLVPREMLRLVPNGVDTALFADVSPEVRESLRRSLGITRQFVWVAVGRFETAKDYPNMLHAFAQVRAGDSNAVLLLVGQGSLQAETEAIARSLGLGDAVRFLGVRNDVSQVMSAADAYVMSSAWEGMPIVLLEAAAAGLPIVATRVGGNHEVAREEDGVILVPPKDSGALGRGMLRLMRLPEEERRSIGRKARDHVRRTYGLNRIAEHWENLYREVLARKTSAITHSPSASPRAP